ncbi:MAG: 50S ribosomal protein L11 methyltransferase, partial [Saprospiraceae bacterium]|nr:50S ribosomal protein L11 methyltransferase [Saprospiraceae bacterium]
EIPHENWNAKWESEFEPIVIPGKCIVRAPFHTASPNLPLEIIIQPKMAFGTGHHATTYLMMERMFELDFKGKTVLDYGCGTGILSILASKLGAIEVFAVDNDPLAVENCLEQLALNNVLNAKVIQNDTPELDNQKFSCILANINRNVLQAQMKALSNRLLPSGILLISGIFEQDSGTMKGLLKEHGFSEIQSSDKDGWVCIEAKN